MITVMASTTTWLDDFVAQHSELESPISFWRWAALASISAVIKDQVWMDRYLHYLYPNIYVMLHADSGLKKGPPISAAKQLVGAVGNTRIISGRSSIQGILKKLSEAETKPGGTVIKKAVAFICSSELSSSIVEDKVATTILTDLYDRQYNQGEWQSLLKMETFNLVDPTITMLTATNESHSDDFFSKKDVSGGYFARTFIVYESKRNRPNSLIAPLTDKPDYKKSAVYLKELAQLNGPFEPMASNIRDGPYTHEKIKETRHGPKTFYFTDSGILYDNWYDTFLTEVDNLSIKDETGTLNRFPDSVLKVAMLISLSREPVLRIGPESMREAIDLCESLVGNVRKTTMGKSKLDDVNAARKVILIRELMKAPDHQITFRELNKKHWMHGNMEVWNDVVRSLEAAGNIVIDTNAAGVMLRMTEEAYQDWDRFLKGKNK